MSSKSAGDKDGAKFAVVRLKPGDDLLKLFQLLIQNGFGEVSFVNNLSETIFPTISGAKTAASPAQTTKSGDCLSATEKDSQTGGRDCCGGENDKAKCPSGDSAVTSRCQLPTQQHPAQFRSVGVDNRLRVEPSFQPNLKSELVVVGDGMAAMTHSRRPVLDLNILSQTTANATGPGATPLPTMPSNFLGLQTANLNSSIATAAAISALTEAVTPPYSLANFFNPHAISSTMSSTLIPLATSGTANQYSPALLAAAAAQQRQATTVSTTYPLPPRPPTSSTLTVSTTQPNRSLPQGQQQRTPNAYQVQQQQLQFPNPQPRYVSSQRSKTAPNKSPAASPGSSSGSSTRSNPQSRLVDGLVPNGMAMPPGCATTQLRQRGQRSYAEDPSLYVACRLCKNKIMGSRISNLTNHVRRHSSMKQFQCCYCDYTHNEMAKVRLHMLHNHKDKDSQPVDNLSPEMQASWDLLMKECFPDHCQQQQYQSQQLASNSPPQQQTPPSLNGDASYPPQRSHYHSTLTYQRNRAPVGSQFSQAQLKAVSNDLQVGNVDQRAPSNEASPTSFNSISSTVDRGTSLSPEEQVSPPADVNQLARLHHLSNAQCVDCGLVVNSKLKARHIRKCHLQYLLPFVCSMCGYDHAEHSKVKVHICLKHDDSPMAQVITRDLSAYAEQLVPEYFPTADGIKLPVDDGPQISGASESNSTPSTDSACSINQAISVETMDYFHQPNICNERRSTGDVEKEPGDSATCVVCRVSIPAVQLVRHARRHAVASMLVYVCSICGQYKSGSRMRINRHMNLSHPVAAKDAKPLAFRRLLTKAVLDGNFVKRAMRRCFASNNIAVGQRLVRTVLSSRRRRKRLRMRTRLSKKIAVSDVRRRKQLQGSNKKFQSLLSVAAAMAPTSPLVNKAPHVEPQILEMSGVPNDLFRVCPLCAHWIRSDQLADHLQSHVSSMGSLYRCSLCEFAATDPLVIQAHCLQVHPKKQVDGGQPQHNAHQAAMLLSYANLCRGSTATAAVDG